MSHVAVTGTVICGATRSRCTCILEPHGKDVAHECDPSICGGSWTYDADGEFQVVRYPRIPGDPISSELALLLALTDSAGPMDRSTGRFLPKDET